MVTTVIHVRQMTWMSGLQMRLEISTGISGVEFEDCYASRIVVDDFDGVTTNIIDLPHLKTNKKAAGRLKDLADLENLP